MIPVFDEETPPGAGGQGRAERLEGLLTLAEVAGLELDAAGRVAASTAPAVALLGEVVGRPLEDLVESSEALAAALERPEASELELRLRALAGPRIGQVRLGPRDPAGRRLVCLRDVTERRDAQEKLRISEERFRKVFYTSPDAISLTRAADGRLVDVNEGFSAITGFSREEVIGKSTMELGLWVDPEARERMRREVTERGVCTDLEARYRTKDGRIIWGSFSARPLQIDGVTHIVSVARDIDDLRRSQEALRTSEARFRSVFENAGDGILLIDLEGWIVEANPAFARALDTRASALAGRRWTELVHPEEKVEVTARLRDVAGEGRGVYEIRHLREAGAVVPMEVGLQPIALEGGVMILAVTRDLSERYELQARLLRSQRLEAVGRLASGVAHDFNNLLTVIRGVSELILDDPAVAGDMRDAILEIDGAAVRAANLTRQLLAFSRKQVLLPARVDLHELLHGMEQMLRRLLPESVRLVLRLESAKCAVRADAGQVEQVVANLVVNARDAIDAHGTIEIRTEQEARNGEDHVVVVVEDDGHGMDEPTRAQIFEPFFTTKERDRGTGLGLATVYGIVRQSRGFVDVRSAPGQGSCFRVGVPAWSGSSTPAEPAAHKKPRSQLVRPTVVLVAEDDPHVRWLVVRALRAHGYRVLEARDGQEALEVAEAFEGDIDLLVSDLVMPRLNGRALRDAVWNRRPTLKVLFISGYADSNLTDGIADDARVAFLTKVFTPADLLARVEALLHAELTSGSESAPG